MTEVKISIIGAGSAQFSMRLLGDLCLTDGLRGSTVCFMDVDEERLDAVHGLAKRYAEEMTRSDLKFEKTLERKVAMQDVDFVINTAALRTYTDIQNERRIARENGYSRELWITGTQGWTIGPYLHQLKFMLTVAKDMEDICPDAWLIQAGNPVFDGCTLMTRKTRTKVIGLCHGWYHGIRRITQVLGLDLEKVSFEAPGVNHCTWMTDFRHENRDAYPIIDEWIRTKAEDYWRTWDGEPGDAHMSPAAVSLYKMFGLFPLGDTPNVAGAWWYHVDDETEKKWFNKYGGLVSEISNARAREKLKKRMGKMFELHNDSSKSVSKEFPPVMSGEQHIPIIDALANDREGKFQVNIPNRGALSGIEDDVVVELPGIVSGRGVQAIRVKALPKHLTLHILRTHVIPMEMGLEALLTGDKRILLNAVLSEHGTRSYEQAQKVLEDVLGLPYNAEFKEHFK